VCVSNVHKLMFDVSLPLGPPSPGFSHKGRLQTETETHIDSTFQQHPWRPLHVDAMTIGMASLAFAMLSATHCSLFMMVFMFMGTFPYRMWSLVIDCSIENASAILATPKCLLDSWSRAFLKKFNTVDRLLSDQARAILLAVGLVARFDICAIECRNAQIRRFCKSSETWLPEFQRVSATFVLRRFRLLSLLRRAFIKLSVRVSV